MRKPYQVREIGHKGKRYGRQIFHVCTHCGKNATREALFKQRAIIVVEKYCDSCLKEEKFTAIMTFYETKKNKEEERGDFMVQTLLE